VEAAVLNARIRKLWLAGRTTIGLVGERADLTYDYEHIGAGAAAVAGLANSDSAFAKALKSAERPAVILGQGALTRPDSAAVLAAVAALGATAGVVRGGWNGWNVLHTAAARVGGLDLGFIPRAGGKTAREMTAAGALDVLFLLGADELDLSATDAFVIYLGTHGDAGAHRADIILPGAAYTEKSGLYVNTEGRVQRGERAVFPKGEAKEDWAVLRALSEHLDARLPYDTLDQLRERLFADHPTFGRIDFAPGSIPTALDLSTLEQSYLGAAGEVSNAGFASPVKAFHLTNPIARASVTMAECAALAAGLKLAAE
jgi:NADH-quinone oxidoreductase subunit G